MRGCGGSTGLSNELLNRQGKKREMIFPFPCHPNLQRRLFVSIPMKRSGFALGVQRCCVEDAHPGHPTKVPSQVLILTSDTASCSYWNSYGI